MASRDSVSQAAGNTTAPNSRVKADLPGTGFLSFDGKPAIPAAVFNDGSRQSYLDYVGGLPLQEALWWFIENGHDELPERTEIFFSLRERVSNEGALAAQSADDVNRIANLVLAGDHATVLDSVVHDECAAFATGLNNDGVHAQVKYLMANGWTEAMILKEAGLNQTLSASSPCP